jgi:predicted phosphodiesterase
MRRTIGAISDTHGLLRPQALAALAGCDPIIHAGDVGSPDVWAALRTREGGGLDRRALQARQCLGFGRRTNIRVRSH